MNKILLLNPAISTLNKGDDIIVESCKKYLDWDSHENFYIDISTHLPLLNNYLKIVGSTKYKIVMGSNLLRGKVNRRFKPWYVKLKNIKYLNDTILMGVGWWSYNDNPNFYTRYLYKKILSKSYLHSVRDEYTKQMLENIGIKNVINTGCPTMWGLNRSHCSKIPMHKSNTVIFTLTDYNKSEELDKKLIKILINNYENLYFWIQGWKDKEYLYQLLNGNLGKIKLLGSTLGEYEHFLINNDCDYVGTRLHAGIKALQLKKRTIIIGIDNRALELKKDYNIICIKRDDIDHINKLINSSFKTEIKINEQNINLWLAQFQKNNNF